MNPLTLLNPARWLLLLAAVAAIVGGGAVLIHRHDQAQQEIGENRVQAKWDAETKRLQAAAINEAAANARESLRRIEKQQENQLAQDRKLSQARADAGRNDAAAGQLRAQLADTARRWRDATRNPTTGGECQAAGDAIVLSAELFSRIDKRAGELAEYADAARIAGEKCTRDYDALMPNSRGAE
jgi:hypothetical protein